MGQGHPGTQPIINGRATSKPDAIAGYQSWRNLLFLHWQVDADRLQAHVPSPLKIQTFDGTAWLGLVPFSMERIRPWWSPPVPGVSWFLETNVRTYVEHPDGSSGVWFFSLDANSRIAVATARRFWHLNYIYSQLSLNLSSGGIVYDGERFRADGGYHIDCHHKESSGVRTAEAGTLDYFLLERYLLYAADRHGQLRTGQVHHVPYRYDDSLVVSCDNRMFGALGLDDIAQHQPSHAAWSPGVDVVVSRLRQMTTPT